MSIADLTQLVDRMKRARFGVNVYRTGLTQTRARHMNVAAVLALTASLNEFTKFVAMPMRDHGNEGGIDNVLSWLAGYPFGVDYTRIRAAVGSPYATDEHILLGIYEAARGSQTRISPRPGTQESPL